MTYEITEDTLAEFPARLKAARVFSRSTQAEAARAIGVTVQTVLKWEKGAAAIQKSKRQAAADFVRSTGVLVAEALADSDREPKEYFIGRLATGPAFDDDELAAAITLGIHREYDGVIDATMARLGTAVPMSSADLSLLVQTVERDAWRQRWQ